MRLAAQTGLLLERNPPLCSDNGMTTTEAIQSVKKFGGYCGVWQKIMSFECWREDKDGTGDQIFVVEIFDAGEGRHTRADPRASAHWKLSRGSLPPCPRACRSRGRQAGGHLLHQLLPR